MSAPVDVLAWIQRQPCRCMSVAQLGERDPGCGRCLSRAAVAELIEKSAAALHYMRLHRYADQAWADDLAEALARVQGGRDHG